LANRQKAIEQKRRSEDLFNALSLISYMILLDLLNALALFFALYSQKASSLKLDLK
jgi:hypothetical protein